MADTPLPRPHGNPVDWQQVDEYEAEDIPDEPLEASDPHRMHLEMVIHQLQQQMLAFIVDFRRQLYFDSINKDPAAQLNVNKLLEILRNRAVEYHRSGPRTPLGALEYAQIYAQLYRDAEDMVVKAILDEMAALTRLEDHEKAAKLEANRAKHAPEGRPREERWTDALVRVGETLMAALTPTESAPTIIDIDRVHAHRETRRFAAVADTIREVYKAPLEKLLWHHFNVGYLQLPHFPSDARTTLELAKQTPRRISIANPGRRPGAEENRTCVYVEASSGDRYILWPKQHTSFFLYLAHSLRRREFELCMTLESLESMQASMDDAIVLSARAFRPDISSQSQNRLQFQTQMDLSDNLAVSILSSSFPRLGATGDTSVHTSSPLGGELDNPTYKDPLYTWVANHTHLYLDSFAEEQQPHRRLDSAGHYHLHDYEAILVQPSLRLKNLLASQAESTLAIFKTHNTDKAYANPLCLHHSNYLARLYPTLLAYFIKLVTTGDLEVTLQFAEQNDGDSKLIFATQPLPPLDNIAASGPMYMDYAVAPPSSIPKDGLRVHGFCSAAVLAGATQAFDLMIPAKTPPSDQFQITPLK
jgi:hypothetical protein